MPVQSHRSIVARTQTPAINDPLLAMAAYGDPGRTAQRSGIRVWPMEGFRCTRTAVLENVARRVDRVTEAGRKP
jgi:hypothetical protein